jgi:transcriptional regulator with XRE-family HTH domain
VGRRDGCIHDQAEEGEVTTIREGAKKRKTTSAASTRGATQRQVSTEGVASFRLGERVHTIRVGKGFTLEQAGKRSNLAPSTLSKIENDQMSPTFEVLQKLAVGLGVDLDEMLTMPRQVPPSARRSVTRAGHGRRHETPAYAHEFLCTDLTHKLIVPSKTRVRARSVKDFPGWVRHDGDDFLLVLEGTVELHTEFYEPVTLEEGDSIYYDAQMGHICISVSPRDAIVLWVPVASDRLSSRPS